MSQRNKFFGFLGLLLVIAAVYYFLSTDRTSDLVLIGTVDANQVVVSPKIMGRVERLAVDEGDEVKAGQTIAVLDSQELTADRQAAAALLNSLRNQVAQTRATEASTSGETSSAVVNAQAGCAPRKPRWRKGRPTCSALSLTPGAPLRWHNRVSFLSSRPIRLRRYGKRSRPWCAPKKIRCTPRRPI